MNSDQLNSAIRTVLAWFFGSAAGAALLAALHITLSDNFLAVVASVFAGVVGVVWSMFTHKSTTA